MQKVCNVAVGTIFSDPKKVREIDADALKNPVNIQKWLLEMNVEEKHPLCNDGIIDTQVLYGEPLLVLNSEDEWSHVICTEQSTSNDNRGYPGYIATDQIGEMNVDESKEFARVVVTKTLSYKDGNPFIVLAFNTTLPYLRTEGDFCITDSPDGELKLRKCDVVIQTGRTPEKTPSFDALYSEARKYIDLGYLWGGMSSYGYDCSGYVYNLYRHLGYLLPRDAGDQYHATEPVKKEHLKKGDLVYFSSKNTLDYITHIGIYIGEGMMIHSPNTPKAIEEITIESGFYNECYVGASRVDDFK